MVPLITTEDKLETQGAEKLFNKHFGETGNAQTAYLKTIQNFSTYLLKTESQ